VFRRTRDGKWVARAELGRKPGGKRDQKLFVADTPAEAIDRRRKFLDQRRDGFTPPKGRAPYVDEWMLHWLHNVAKRKVQPTTWEGSYRQKVTDLICPYFASVPLPDLTEDDVERWHGQLEAAVSERTGRPLSASTIGQAHRIMSSALKEAVRRGRMQRNPCSNVTPPTVTELELVPPTAAEVDRVLERCRTWPNGARWVLAVTTGLRQGEALDLEWRYVQLTRPALLRVEWSAAWVNGERIRKRPKSETSRRPVPLAAVLIAALEAHRKAQVRSIAPDYVFTDGKGRPVHPRADWQDWQDLLADLGLPHYRVHDLRHCYATMLLESGQDPRVVQAMLGHSSPVLLKRYQHVRPVMHQAVADAIDRAVGGGVTPPVTPDKSHVRKRPAPVSRLRGPRRLH
jgi:integrase